MEDDAMIDLELTQDVLADGRYDRFLAWGRENGVLMTGVRMPAVFGQFGLIGVAADEDLPANKTILGVPKKMIITPDLTLAIPELQPTITKLKKHMENDKDDHDFKMLMLFFIYQRLKGSNSFFKPYFDILPQKGFNILEWRDKYPHLLGFLNLDKEMTILQNEINQVFEKIYLIFEEEELLKQFGIDKEALKQVYWWAEYCLMTRSFGWSMPSTCMIPFADLLNHFDHDQVTHFILDLKQELGPTTSQLYEIKHHTIDCTLFPSIKTKPTKVLTTKYDKYCADHKLEIAYESRVEAKRIVQSHAFNLLKNGKLDLRDLFFLDSSCTEDNDSQDEEREQQEKIINNIRGRQIKRLREEDSSYKDIRVSIEKTTCKYQDDDYQDEEEKSWQAYSQSSYLISSTTHAIRKGEQLKYSYGKRNNKFLLTYYGFSPKHNRFDSYAFRITMDFSDYTMPIQHVPQEILFFQSALGLSNETHFEHRGRKCLAKQLSRQIRLKKQLFCQQLFIFLRVLLQCFYSQDSSKKEPMAMYATSIAYQQYIMRFYSLILAHLRQRLPDKPTLVDNPMLASISHLIDNYNCILDSQERMVKVGVELLLMLKNKIPLREAITKLHDENPPSLCRMLTPYIKNLAVTESVLRNKL